jgi:hypothetical protein
MRRRATFDYETVQKGLRPRKRKFSEEVLSTCNPHPLDK